MGDSCRAMPRGNGHHRKNAAFKFEPWMYV